MRKETFQDVTDLQVRELARAFKNSNTSIYLGMHL